MYKTVYINTHCEDNNYSVSCSVATMNPKIFLILLDHSKPLCMGYGFGQSLLQFGFRGVVTKH